MIQQQEPAPHFSEKELVNKITLHFKSKAFPSSGSQQLSESLQALGNKSTNITSANKSELSALQNPVPNNSINPDLAPMFSSSPSPSPASQKDLTQDAKTIIKSKDIFPDNELHDQFDANDDPLMTGHPIPLNNNSTVEESSSVIKSHQNVPPGESKDIEEEHKSSQENYNKTSQDLPQITRVLFDCGSFLGPAAQVLISLISENSQLQASTFPTHWMNDGLLDFCKFDNSGEYLAFLQYFVSKKTQIEDFQTLLTLLNSDRRLAFPIFSFNLLKSLDTNDDRLLMRYRKLFALYCTNDKVRRAAAYDFSVIFCTIFEARVNHSLAHFEYKVGVLESFEIFKDHPGVKQLMKMLLDLFKDLRKTFLSLELSSLIPWQLQNEDTFDQFKMNGSPKYAKHKLCELLEDIIDFIRENEWMFLLKLSPKKIEIFQRSFKKADDFIRECLKNIWKMIEKNEI